jgi:hypothetical protein
MNMTTSASVHRSQPPIPSVWTAIVPSPRVKSHLPCGLARGRRRSGPE